MGVVPTITPLPEPSGAPHGWKIVWLLADGQTGNAVVDLFLRQGDRSVQVEGTFGGSTCQVQGSNDGTNFHTLHDPLGNILNYTSAGLNQILEVADQMAPTIVGGSGISLTITMLIRSGYR
jgi:hypothetical protein